MKIPVKKRSKQDTIENRIFHIIRNLAEYHIYNNDIVNASKILRKYFPDISKEKSISLLTYYYDYYNELSEIIGNNREEFKILYMENKVKVPYRKEMHKEENIVHSMNINNEKVLLWMMNFIIHWHLIR
jgi:hypothetical protein